MGPGLFDLPRGIRERIYRFAGLAMDRENVLLLYGGRTNPNWNHVQPNYATTNALLRVCRVMTDEVAFLLYSTNTFYIRYGESSDMQPLLRLSPAILRTMRSLRVYLNVASCRLWGCSGPTDGGWPWGRVPYDRPLVGSSIEGKRRLGDWHQAAQHIGMHIQPNQLDLAFSCDCADLETAQLAVDTFLYQLPQLAVCSIRLARHQDPEMMVLAEHAAFWAVGLERPYRPHGHFRFMDLPSELRLLILNLTDLITPMREVSWAPDVGYHVRHRWCRCRGGLQPDGNELDGHPLIAHTWAESLYGHYSCKFRDCVKYSERGCFCKRYHSACTTASPGCSCWEPPTYLFLISKAFRSDAQAVFFNKNRFTVFGEHPPSGEHPRYPASIFLQDTVPDGCLRYLRFLEIAFPEFDQYEPHSDPAFHDWEHAIELLQDKLDLPRLTVRVCMQEDHDPHTMHSTLRETMTEPQGRALQQAYQDMTAPLKRWGYRGLHRFFAHFAWPWYCTQWGEKVLWEWHCGLREPVERKETLAERTVMGPEYDGVALGKDTTKQSEWLIDNISSSWSRDA